MSELEELLSEWLGLDDDEIAECAQQVRAAVAMDQFHEDDE